MTEHLEKCLAKLPKRKWFTEDDIVPGMFKRARYVLDSLEKNGKLDSKVVIDKELRTRKFFKVSRKPPPINFYLTW